MYNAQVRGVCSKPVYFSSCLNPCMFDLVLEQFKKKHFCVLYLTVTIQKCSNACVAYINIWALMRENLSSGFATNKDTD